MSPTKHMLRPPLIPPEENEITLQQWNRELKESGLVLPGPTIQQAQNAQYGWLIVKCAGCGRTAHVPFEINPTPARNANRGPTAGPNLHALWPERAAGGKNPRRHHARRRLVARCPNPPADEE